ATTAARILMGLIFFVFGLNGFIHFLPQPPMSEPAAAFAGALAASGYLFPLLKGVEVVAGALLLVNRAAPLAIVALAPIIANIAGFHLALEPAYGMVVVLTVLEVYLAYAYRRHLLPLLGRGG